MEATGLDALYAMLGIRPNPPPSPRWTTNIMSLPAEILVACFYLASVADAETSMRTSASHMAANTKIKFKDESASKLPCPIALSHVCERWRALVLDASCLWTALTLVVKDEVPCSEGQRELVKLWATRSQSAPLDIHVFLSPSYENAHEAEEGLPAFEEIGQFALEHKRDSCSVSSCKQIVPVLESGLDIATSIAQESYQTYFNSKTQPTKAFGGEDGEDAHKVGYAVKIDGHRHRARPKEVRLPTLVRDRYGVLQTSLTKLCLRGGATGHQTQTLSAEELLVLLRDFPRLRSVQAHVSHQHDNQRLHVPLPPSPAVNVHHVGDAPAVGHPELELPVHNLPPAQGHLQHPQNPDHDFEDETVTAPHLQHLDLSWDAIANVGLALGALHAPALAQLALRRRGASPFWLGHWEHLLHFLSRPAGTPPLQALVLQNLDCTTLKLGACLALCAETLEGVALESCVFDESEMRGFREGVGRCARFKMLSVLDCPGITKEWRDGMERVMMRRSVQTNIRLLQEPRRVSSMW